MVPSGWQHYLSFGQYQGYNPDPYFSEKSYLAANPDVAAAVRSGMFSSGFFHFLNFGQYEGRDPSPFFNTAFYLAADPDVASAIQGGMTVGGVRLSAFNHYLLFGQHQGRNPTPIFDEHYYLAQNADVAGAVASGMLDSGYEHYILTASTRRATPRRCSTRRTTWRRTRAWPASINVLFASGYEHFLHVRAGRGSDPAAGFELGRGGLPGGQPRRGRRRSGTRRWPRGSPTTCSTGSCRGGSGGSCIEVRVRPGDSPGVHPCQIGPGVVRLIPGVGDTSVRRRSADFGKETVP